jgi:hypothetical protein
MIGNSKTLPLAVELLKENAYQLRWNIQRNDRPLMIDTPAVENYDFEYNTKYLAKSVTKKEIMLAIIREKYDTSDEISIAMKREPDAAKFQEHEDYVQFARITAENILAE